MKKKKEKQLMGKAGLAGIVKTNRKEKKNKKALQGSVPEVQKRATGEEHAAGQKQAINNKWRD